MRPRQRPRQAVLHQIIRIDAIAQQRTGVPSKRRDMLSQGRLHHPFGQMLLACRRASNTPHERRTLAGIPCYPYEQASSATRNQCVRTGAISQCEENRARNFCLPRSVIGVTVTHQASWLRRPEHVQPHGDDLMEKRWLIAAAFLSAASLVACDNSGSKSSGSTATPRSPSSSGSSSATSPSGGAGSTTSPSSGSSSSGTSGSSSGAGSSPSGNSPPSSTTTPGSSSSGGGSSTGSGSSK